MEQSVRPIAGSLRQRMVMEKQFRQSWIYMITTYPPVYVETVRRIWQASYGGRS